MGKRSAPAPFREHAASACLRADIDTAVLNLEQLVALVTLFAHESAGDAFDDLEPLERLAIFCLLEDLARGAYRAITGTPALPRA
ncbi:protein of unknown function (plasmid) [Paraburkholderia kururiensis]|uniref:hypothetical protein n=1 Tax=Paraburkholderia kururiensis TaxID=984307 RepID=UPI0039A6D71D